MIKKKTAAPSEEVREQISKVFKSFDKDNSGFIDIKEVRLAAKELGQEINEKEIESIFSEIDTNKDKKISFKEFLDWWYYGKVNKMEQLVFYKLKVMNLLEKNKSLQVRLGSILAHKYEAPETDKVQIAIRFGDFEPKTKIGLEFSAGQTSQKRFEKITEGLEVNQDFSLVFKIKASQDATTAENTLKEIVQKFLESLETPAEAEPENPDEVVINPLAMFSSMVDWKTRSDGEYVYFVITTSDLFLTSSVEAATQSVLQNLDEKFDSNFSVSLKLKNDFNTLLNDNADDKFVLSLLEGFAFELDANVNSDFTKNVRKELGNMAAYLGDEVPPHFKSLLYLGLLKGAKAEINLKELEKSKLEKILNAIGSSNALKATPSFIQLLDLLKKIGITTQFERIPLLKDLVVLIRSQFKADFEVYAKVDKLLGVLSFQTSGLSECYDYILDRNE